MRTSAASAFMALLTACAGTSVVSASGVAADEPSTCNGLPATEVTLGPPGYSGTPVYGTEGDDVIVATDPSFVRAYGGDDAICVIGGSTGKVGYVQAGPGDDYVDASQSTRVLLVANLGDGADTFLGSPNQDNVNTDAEPITVDNGVDTVRTMAGKDRVFAGTLSGSDQLMNDDIDLGIDGGSVELSANPAPGAILVGGPGAGSSVHWIGEGAAWSIVVPAHRMVVNGAVGTLSGFDYFDVYGEASTLDFVGGPADESLRFGGAELTANLGGGDDWVQMDVTTPSDLIGGPGRDQVVLLGPAGRQAPSVGLRVDLRQGQFTLTGDVNRKVRLRSFEDAYTRVAYSTMIGTDGPNELTVVGCTRRILGLGGRDDLNAYTPGRCNANSGVVLGGKGRDHMRGGSGPDILQGGPGRDTADGQRSADTCIAEVKRNCERRE